MAFHRWTTGYCLGNFFMHTTLIFYLHKMLRLIVWKEYSHYNIRTERGTAFVFWDGITLSDIQRHPSGRVMAGLIYYVLLVNISAHFGQIGGYNDKISSVPR